VITRLWILVNYLRKISQGLVVPKEELPFTCLPLQLSPHLWWPAISLTDDGIYPDFVRYRPSYGESAITTSWPETFLRACRYSNEADYFDQSTVELLAAIASWCLYLQEKRGLYYDIPNELKDIVKVSKEPLFTWIALHELAEV